MEGLVKFTLDYQYVWLWCQTYCHLWSVGKYATSQLVSKLPLRNLATGTLERANAASEETIRAVLATLHEVFKHKDADSADHARSVSVFQPMYNQYLYQFGLGWVHVIIHQYIVNWYCCMFCSCSFLVCKRHVLRVNFLPWWRKYFHKCQHFPVCGKNW